MFFALKMEIEIEPNLFTIPTFRKKILACLIMLFINSLCISLYIFDLYPNHLIILATMIFLGSIYFRIYYKLKNKTLNENTFDAFCQNYSFINLILLCVNLVLTIKRNYIYLAIHDLSAYYDKLFTIYTVIPPIVLIFYFDYKYNKATNNEEKAKNLKNLNFTFALMVSCLFWVISMKFLPHLYYVNISLFVILILTALILLCSIFEYFKLDVFSLPFINRIYIFCQLAVLLFFINKNFYTIINEDYTNTTMDDMISDNTTTAFTII